MLAIFACKHQYEVNEASAGGFVQPGCVIPGYTKAEFAKRASRRLQCKLHHTQRALQRVQAREFTAAAHVPRITLQTWRPCCVKKRIALRVRPAGVLPSGNALVKPSLV